MQKTFTLLIIILLVACSKNEKNSDAGDNQPVTRQQVKLEPQKEENPDSIITDDWGGNADWELADPDTTD